MPSYDERLKEGACRECDRLFTKGVNGWRKVSLADLERFTSKDHGQMHNRVLHGFLCVKCVHQKFAKGKLLCLPNLPSDSRMEPPVCLECGHLFITDHDFVSKLETCQKKKTVSLRKRYGVSKGVLCKWCADILYPSRAKAFTSQQSTQPSVDVVHTRKENNCTSRQNGLGRKIESITMTSGKKMYGTSKRAVIVREMKQFKHRYGQCWSCKCKTGAKMREKIVNGAKLESFVSRVNNPPEKKKMKEEVYVKDKVTLAYSKRDFRLCTMRLSRNRTAWKHMKRAVDRMLKREANEYKKKLKRLLIGKGVTQESLTDFSWATILKDAKTYMPSLMEFLSAIFPSGSEFINRRQRMGANCTFEGEGDMMSEARLGFIVALISYSLNPRLSLVQSLLSLEAQKFGVVPEMTERLAKLGVLLHNAKTSNIHCKEMQLLDSWKTNALSVPTQDTVQAPKKKTQPEETPQQISHRLRYTPWRLAKRPKIVVSLSSQDVIPPITPGPDILPPEVEKGLGFCLFWKEIRMKLGRTRFTSGKPSKGVVLFAVRNRVNFSNLSEEPPCMQAKDISLKALLPDYKDYAEERRRLEYMVVKILVKHLGRTDVAQPQSLTLSIPHRCSKPMKEKSEIVHLGIMKEDPSTYDGYKAILQELGKHVPVDQEGQPMPTPLYADTQTLKSILTMNLDADEVSSQAQGLVPVIHEFTKIRGHLRDFFDLFYCHHSRGDKGTVYELMEAFRYYCSYDGEDDKRCAFLQLMTESHVIMLAKKLGDREGWDLDCTSSNFLNVCKRLAMLLVDFLWCEEYLDQIQEVITAEEQGRPAQNLRSRSHTEDEIPMETESIGCHCGQNLNEGIVRCAFLHCPHPYFHLSCVGMTSSTVPDGKWWCSDSCEAKMSDDSYAFCFCHTYEEDVPMIQCELAGRCTENQWYHFVCLQMNEENMPKNWFCSDACKAQERPPTQDYMQNYATELTWQGLKHMTRMDAIHEGDGKAMLSYWKLDLLNFWNKHNWAYTIVAHHFLSGVCGLFSPRLSQELIWNRVANITGLQGDNVGLDQVDELLNRDFRDLVKHSGGFLTEKQADQHNISGGRLSNLHHLFFCKEQCDLLGRRQTARNHKEVADLVSNYEGKRFFDHVPGRHHLAFPDFKVDHTLRDPHLLAGDLKKLGELLDRPKKPNTSV